LGLACSLWPRGRRHSVARSMEISARQTGRGCCIGKRGGHKMTFEQISYFLALAQEKSFVRAANRCGIAQPSLTKAIRSLERSLGAPLFERTTKGTRLTYLGTQLWPLLAELHRERLRALAIVRAFNLNALRSTDVCFRTKQVSHSKGDRFGRYKRRAIAFGLAAVFTCTMHLTAGRAQPASDSYLELLVRQSLFEPLRCTQTPIFFLQT
jgi:hypothetical protein